jgi:RNA polymerase sigma-70 factor (ECF subfamily)
MSTADSGEDEGDREIADSSREPHQLVEKKELGEVIEKAIGSLEEDARRIIILRDILGESYQAIASEEGLTLGTVKTRVHRARLELRVILADFL